MTEQDRAPSRRVAWATAAILWMATVLAYMDRNIIALMVEPMKLSLGATDFQMGLLQGIAFGLFFAIFGLPMGWLVDRYSRRIIIFFGMTCWSLAASFCGIAANFTQLLIARFGVGVGEATLSPAAYSMAADLFPARRLALVIGIIGSGAMIGGSLAFAVGGMLIQALERGGPVVLPVLGALESWQMVFILTGLPGFFVAFLLFAIPEPGRSRPSRPPVPEMTDLTPAATGLETAGRQDDGGFARYLMANARYYVCHFFGFSLLALTAYGAAAWTPTMLVRHYGLDLGTVGWIMGIVSFAFGLPGFLFSGWIADRLYAAGHRDAHFRYYVFATSLMTVMGVIAFQFTSSLWITVACFSLTYFLSPATGPAVAHLQMATPSSYRGRATALFFLMMTLIGLCIGPPMVAFFTDFVFRDPARVNSSLALLYAIFGPISALFTYFGMKPARTILDRRQA